MKHKTQYQHKPAMNPKGLPLVIPFGLLLFWAIIGLIIFALVGCSYNAFNDPNMRFWDQPAPIIYPIQNYLDRVCLVNA